MWTVPVTSWIVPVSPVPFLVPTQIPFAVMGTWPIDVWRFPFRLILIETESALMTVFWRSPFRVVLLKVMENVPWPGLASAGARA